MRKILLFTAALLVALSQEVWGGEVISYLPPTTIKPAPTEGPWTFDTARNEFRDIYNVSPTASFNDLGCAAWGAWSTWDSITYQWQNDDYGTGFAMHCKGVKDSRYGVYSIYEFAPEIPTYTRARLKWHHKLHGYTSYYPQCVALYTHTNLDELKSAAMDFTADYSYTPRSEYYMSHLVIANNDHTEKRDSTEESINDFLFDNLYGDAPQTMTRYLMLTHVVFGQDEDYVRCNQSGGFKSYKMEWLYDYYKIVTFDANGGTGEMEALNFTTIGKLPANTFTRDGYTFLGWATTKKGSLAYLDTATITATADSKGPVTLYAQWIPTNYTPAVFNYAYDCQRDPAFPLTYQETAISGIGAPHVGLNGIGMNIDNNPAGPWKVEYIEMFDANHIAIYTDKEEHIARTCAYDILHEYYITVPSLEDSIAFNTFAHEHLPVYRLYQWNPETNDYQGVAYGYAINYAHKNNVKGRNMLFVEAGYWIGCFLTDSVQSANITITFNTMLSDGILTLQPASIYQLPTGAVNLAYNTGAQALIGNKGLATKGTMVFKLEDGEWSEDSPTAVNPGTYTVYYKVIGGVFNNIEYADYTPENNTIDVTISKATPAYITRPYPKPHLIYNGEAQYLMEQGTIPEGSAIWTYSGGLWSILPEPVSATQPGNYYVSQKIGPYIGYGDKYNFSEPETWIASIYASENPDIPQHDDYPANKILVLRYHQGLSTYEHQEGDKLFDGHKENKWCSWTEDIDLYPDPEWGKDMVVWKTADTVKMVSYTLTTGSDTQNHPNRNWSSWTLYGSSFESDDDAKAALYDEDAWTIIDNQIQDSVMQAVSQTDYQFVCNNPGTYQYYRLVIHSLKVVDPNDGKGVQQMGELTMGIEKATTPTDIEITNDQLPKTNKILRDGTLLIEKNGKLYNALGAEVK